MNLIFVVAIIVWFAFIGAFFFNWSSNISVVFFMLISVLLGLYFIFGGEWE